MVGTGAFAGLCTALVMSGGAPVAIWFVARRRTPVPPIDIALGAATFFLMVVILEAALHNYLLRANPATTAWFTTHRLAYAAYGIAAAALFEEAGRVIALQFLAKRTIGPGAGLAYGIGHGGLESILIGVLPQARALYMAWMLNAGRFGEIAAGYSPIARQQIVSELDALTFLSAAYAGIERLTALLIQIALSLIVWRAVSQRRWALIALAIVLHAAADAPAALLQAGYLAPLPVTSFYALLGACLFAIFAGRFLTARSA
jgi:uncharacterized membrane protein YhfC